MKICLSVDNISIDESKKTINKFFDQNLNKKFIYEIIFEDKNLRHISSQCIRLHSFLLSFRILRFIPPSFANHVGQIFNKNGHWHFSEITPKKNYRVESFVEFLSHKVQFNNFYGKIYIRPKDIKPKNWNPEYHLAKYSVIAAILSGISGLIIGIMTYKAKDPLKICKEPKLIFKNSNPDKITVLDLIKFIFLLPLVFMIIPLVLFRVVCMQISNLLIKRYQICSSMVDVYTGTILDTITACSRVPTPQDWLLYGNIIRFNSELCVTRHAIQGIQIFIDKFQEIQNEHVLIVEVLKGKNIKIRRVLNLTLNKYLTKGAKYPDYLR